MAAVEYVEAGDGYVGYGACCSERCEGAVMACLPAERSGSPQAWPPSIVSVETVLVR